MTSPSTMALGYLHQLDSLSDSSDSELVNRFSTHQDERAFCALVRRHGAMVLGVCRRILRCPQDIEDVFQATFLVLVEKAQTIAPAGKVGNWLYGVAYRTAVNAKARRAQRVTKERAASKAEAVEEQAEPAWRAVLDAELESLPEKYRTPIVLCDLEGLTRREAASQLGWPEGTVAGRLARAREALAKRLTRRGVALSVGTLALALSSSSSANVPLSLLEPVLESARVFAIDGTWRGAALSPGVVALMKGVLMRLAVDKAKVAAVWLALVVVVGGLGLAQLGAFEPPTRLKDGKELYPEPRLAPKGKPLPPKKPRPFYDVKLHIEEVDAKGRRDTLSRPRLRTVASQPARLFVGQEVPIPLDKKPIQTVSCGVSCTIRVHEVSETELLVDLDLEVSKLVPNRTSEIRVRGTSTRIVKKVTPGKSFRIGLHSAKTKGNRIEATIVVAPTTPEQ